MRRLVHQAKRIYGDMIAFYWMNTEKASVRTIIRRKYPCVGRIPSVVARGDVYWTGLPDKKDFIGVLGYLMSHPEGGKGAFHD